MSTYCLILYFSEELLPKKYSESCSEEHSEEVTRKPLIPESCSEEHSEESDSNENVPPTRLFLKNLNPVFMTEILNYHIQRTNSHSDDTEKNHFPWRNSKKNDT